jgi:carbon-monoxide dehydrogenase large subunit
VTIAPPEPRTRPAFGRPLLRFEDQELLTGAAQFLDDIALPGMLHAAFLRSPLAHGAIVRADVTPALALPEVVAAFTASDLTLPPLVSACETPNAYCPGRPLLADGVVRFVGEAVAVVVAVSRYAAEDAVEAIAVDFRALDVVADVRRALADDAPRLHPGRPNVYHEWPSASSAPPSAAASGRRHTSTPRRSSSHGSRAGSGGP